MSLARLAFTWSDGITSNTGHNYGPVTIAGAFELVRVRMRGSLAFEPATVSPTTEVATVVIMGISAVASGSGAIDPNGDAGDLRWLTWQSQSQGPYSIVTAETLTSYILGQVDPLCMDWDGHKAYTAATDFYLSIGYFSGPFGQSWVSSGSVDIWFNT